MQPYRRRCRALLVCNAEQSSVLQHVLIDRLECGTLSLCVQDAFADVKAEVRQLLADHGVTKMSIRPVQRSYAFEDRAVAAGEQWVIKVKYPGNQAALPAGLRGAHFSPRTLHSTLRLSTARMDPP